MGLEIAAAVLGGVAIASDVGQAQEQVNAANAEEEALNTQSKELALQTQQKTLSNYDVMEKVLDAQVAHMTVTGTAFSSPSFNAIQRNTLNIGAKEQKNTEIEGDLAQDNIDIEKQNVKSKLYSELFGDVSNASMAAFSAYTKMPKMPADSST
jgi:hypothetical protein